ncbi:MAG: site-specific integrase, partial [Bacteroidales bacterium]|nr:site-specific integrase [Bacteroidales bacterium]
MIQKTADGIKIELNNTSQAILNKYKKMRFKNNLALPIISNQKMNEALKEMGYKAGIKSPQRIVYFRQNERIEEVHPKYSLLSC